MSVRELRELFTQKEKQDPNKSISHGGIKTLQQEEETDDAASVIMNEGSIDDFTDLLEEARDLVPNENSFESEETGGSDPSSLSKDSFAHGGTVEIHPDTLKQLEEATKRLEEEENKKLEEERITNLKGKERKNSGRVVRFNEESDFRRSRGSIYLKKNTNEQEREYSQQNYMKVPLKKLAQLQSDEGFWDLTPALAEILGLLINSSPKHLTKIIIINRIDQFTSSFGNNSNGKRKKTFSNLFSVSIFAIFSF